MTRHIIAGRFGETDQVRIGPQSDEVVSPLDLMKRDKLDHGIGNAVSEMAALKLAPSEIGVDLLVVAAHAYAADTRISRDTESKDSWTREIGLLIPVSDPVIWTAATPILVRALNFLTGDRWTVEFRARPERYGQLAKPPSDLVGPQFDGVSLFSGGLDSLIGAIDSLTAERAPLLVSHAGEGLVSKSQDECFQGLKSAFPRSVFNRLRLWMNFDDGLVEGVGKENTTRGRSFLFFALAVAAGTGLGKPFVLSVPENGLIALNVPLDPLRLGALSTRTTHPFYIARWNELIAALGIVGQLENPYWNKTKGEMVRECADPTLLRKLTPSSLSCSSPTKSRWRKIQQGHCGYCLPCLIRRAALLGLDDTEYFVVPDLKAAPLNAGKAEGEQVRSFQMAVDRLRRRPELASILVHKPGPLLDDPEHIPELAAVYGRGMAEVGRLLDGVITLPG